MAAVSPFQSSVATLRPGVGDQLLQLRRSGSVWRQADVARIDLSGADAAQWLHGQCSQSIVDMTPGQGRFATLLDPRGKLLNTFEVLCSSSGFILLVDSTQGDGLIERFENFIFSEDVQVRLIANDLECLWVQGSAAEEALHKLDAWQPLALDDRSWLEHDDLVWRRATRTGEAGVAVVGPSDPVELIHDELLYVAKGSLLPMGDQAALIARLEAGLAEFGRELSTKEILPETPWMELGYRPGKGCFTGQEIVERLRMKGSPKLALVALVGDQSMPTPELGSVVRIEGKNEGVFRASVPSSSLDGRLHYALLKRRHREPGAQLNVEVDGSIYPVVLHWLPPVAHRRERVLVDQLYEQALQRFTQDQDERDAEVIRLLSRAHQLDPSHQDTLELLGVALHRRGERSRAIELMLALVEGDPKSVMGWSNLSRFYAEEGRIEEAEEAQGKATLISFQRDMADRRAAAQNIERAQAEKVERHRRMEMFREVLEFDPDDLVALFGLGKAFAEEDQPADAVEPLSRAVTVKPDYAAAWLELGRCQEKVGQTEAAQTSYESGIAVAARRGELMPMRAMERRLAALRTPAV